jgi:hypothetical protein
MGQYVFSQELGTENNVSYSVDIFKESNTEYRPILTAQHTEAPGMGCSNRRSFKSQNEARNFYLNNLEQLKAEALKDLQS